MMCFFATKEVKKSVHPREDPTKDGHKQSEKDRGKGNDQPVQEKLNSKNIRSGGNNRQ
jgi:hypothetical protein